MLKVTRIIKKPNLETRWFHEFVSPKYRDYIKRVYIDTGKLVQEMTYDESGLIQTSVHIWSTAANFQEFKDDPVPDSFHDQRRGYEIANNFEIIIQDQELIGE